MEHIVRKVAQLGKGQSIEVTANALELYVPAFHHNGVLFTSADNVLEQIMGSAYEFSYQVNELKRTVTFSRLKEPLTDGRKSYESPDKRNKG